jgi:predicted metal-dependent hydrolase
LSTKPRTITVSGLKAQIVRKNIKNLHLGVYPPNGRVRVAAPLAVTDDAIRLAIIGKLDWIRRQRDKFANQPRQTQRDALSGESHYLFGRRYRLSVIVSAGRPRVVLSTKTRMEIHVPARTNAATRRSVMDRWYRDELRSAVGLLLEQWQEKLEVSISFWGMKRMKTKWGSCNHQTRRIWLNSELAKKPLECVEYIVVHELVHLLEPTHGERFVALMNRYLPDWRRRRDLLRSSPLSHESWTY